MVKQDFSEAVYPLLSLCFLFSSQEKNWWSAQMGSPKKLSFQALRKPLAGSFLTTEISPCPSRAFLHGGRRRRREFSNAPRTKGIRRDERNCIFQRFSLLSLSLPYPDVNLPPSEGEKENPPPPPNRLWHSKRSGRYNSTERVEGREKNFG